MFLTMTRRAVHKNHNSTLWSFCLIIPLLSTLIFNTFIAKGMTCCTYIYAMRHSAELKTHDTALNVLRAVYHI